MDILKITFAVIVVSLLAFIAFNPQVQVSDLGSAPSGLNSVNATSSEATVGTSAIELFADNTRCTARIITTVSEPIMLHFGEIADASGYGLSSTTLSGIFGHLQAASTTERYDSGLYGCGIWSAISASAVASTITITEQK